MQVRGKRPLTVYLDALGQPAPTGVRSSHLPINNSVCVSVGTQVCMGLAEHACACVDPRQGYRCVRCGVPEQLRRTRLRQASAAEPACERPACAHTTDPPLSSRTSELSMLTGAWRGHTCMSARDLFVVWVGLVPFSRSTTQPLLASSPPAARGVAHARQAREQRRRRRSPSAARLAGCSQTSRRAALARRRCASSSRRAPLGKLLDCELHAPTSGFSFVGTAKSPANGWVPPWHTWSGAPVAGWIKSGSTCLARLPGRDGSPGAPAGAGPGPCTG